MKIRFRLITRQEKAVFRERAKPSAMDIPVRAMSFGSPGGLSRHPHYEIKEFRSCAH